MDSGPRYLLPFDTFRLPQHMAEVLVVGAGVAGASAALAALDAGLRVHLLAKGPFEACNTAWAQGGVAAVLGDGDDAGARRDSAALHAKDTLEVGCGLCDEEVVRVVTEEADDRVLELLEAGARFDRDEDGDIARGLEGGHSRPRILHAGGDATGAEIRVTLERLVRSRADVTAWSDAFLVDLVTDDEGVCRGALVHSKGHLRVIWAGAVVLATGGYAQIYRESTNVAGATGDGVMAAWRAGASVRDLEFVQFHPTTLYLAGVPRLLITEAVRGEGAHIVDDQGRRFVLDADSRGELAPRDVISRLIMAHLQRPEVTGVFLDLRHLEAGRIARRFPGVARSCAAHGLDIGRDRIPIRPAAHYCIGGVRTDLDGASDVRGLFAAGEASSSGLHGANRLASNSLLEGLVLGRRAGAAAAVYARTEPARPRRLRGDGTGSATGVIDVDDLRASLKALLWREAGILRSAGHLEGAAGAIAAWRRFAERVGADDPARLALINMLGVAEGVVTSALLREESRGTHARRDAPGRDDDRWRAHIVHKRGKPVEVVPLPAAAVLENEASA